MYTVLSFSYMNLR